MAADQAVEHFDSARQTAALLAQLRDPFAGAITQLTKAFVFLLVVLELAACLLEPIEQFRFRL